MTCITPRALAADTIALLNPLSCQAIAATDWISPAPTNAGVGSGSAAGTTGAGAGSAARAGVGAPLGSLITVPATSTPFGSSPFMAAIASVVVPAPAARPESV